MQLLTAFLLLLAIVYVAFIQIDAYNALKAEKFRLRFFAIRDELALLVCQGSLKEDSWEYKYIIDALNFHISVVERLSIVEVAEAFLRIHSSTDENKVFERFTATADREDVKLILGEYMEVVRQMLLRNSKWQIRAVTLVKQFLDRAKVDISDGAKSAVLNPKPALAAIEHHKSQLMASFGGAHC